LPQLFSLAGERGLPRRDVDLGYLVHCQLGELFREAPPTLFAIPSQHRPAGERANDSVEVLGYASTEASEMLERARRFATPDRWDALVEGSVRSKPMPRGWERGMELGFELRGCPVVRTRRSRTSGERLANPREIDAFLAKVEANPESPVGTLNREGIYREWLAARFVDRSGCDLEACKVISMRRDRFVRRTQKQNEEDHRRSKVLERPDVVFQGRLRVKDGDAFNQTLAHGLGRHRAFGFGMLLLKPASEAGC